MYRVFVLYALSGFISLGYQVSWFRIVTDWFGSTNLTFALVICNFVGGLGAGALLSDRVTRLVAGRFRFTDGLRVYGMIELSVAVAATMTLLGAQLPPDLLGSFPYVLDEGIWYQANGYRALQLALATGCVFVPCFLMGVTFPLLCHVFVNEPRGRVFPSALYAWNTFGACTGILVCQFFLIYWLGHDATFLVMIILNLLLGLYFLVMGGAPAPAATAAAPAREVASTGTHDAGVGSNNLGALLLFAGLSGLLSGALEGDMFKRISFLLGPVPGATMSFISFWAILAIFLGSTAVRVLPRLKLFNIKGAFLLAFAYYVGIWALRDEVIGNYLPLDLFGLLKFTGMFVFPPYLLISLLLPWVCNHIQAERRHLGIAYGLNTVAFCAGLLAFTAVAPRVNIFYSTKLFILLFAVAILMLMLLSNQRRVSWFVVAGASAALILSVVLIPHTFDRSYFRPGSDPSRKVIRALRSNGAHTTYVVESGDADYRLSLFFGSHSMSDTGLVAQTYMRLMAHLPLLSQDNPQRALLICYGVGNTASAIAAHSSIRQIDVVDLNDRVLQTAPEFALTNNDVHRDPRLRMINDDGRGFLRLTDEKYDLITSEPPPPMVEGVYRLYSREYYEAALERLTQDGIMTQWLPTSSLSQEATDLIVSTFLDSFPHTLLFRGWKYRGNRGSELLLAGSRKPIDTDKIIRNFRRDQTVVDDLARIGVRSGVDIALRIQADEKQLAKFYANIGILSDQHNDLEHGLINPTLPPPTVRW